MNTEITDTLTPEAEKYINSYPLKIVTVLGIPNFIFLLGAFYREDNL